MWRALGVFLGFQLLAGLCSGVTVTQKEKFIAIQNGREARIPCEHDDKTYITVLWYQQKGAERQLQLVAFSVDGNPAVIEDQFKTRFNVTRPATLNTSLTINPGTVEDTAVYFCAATLVDSDAQVLRSTNPRVWSWKRDTEPSSYVTKPMGITTCSGGADVSFNQTLSLVLERGKTAELQCEQNINYDYMYWYQQLQGKGLHLIYYSYDTAKTLNPYLTTSNNQALSKPGEKMTFQNSYSA
nr:uncharacterized protein LOC122174160 [Chrysemys picta bellii]